MSGDTDVARDMEVSLFFSGSAGTDPVEPFYCALTLHKDSEEAQKMVEKREAERSTQKYELVLSHDDILDLMEDPDVGLDPAADQEIYLYIRKANDSEINLNLRPLYENDKIVFRFYKVVNTSTDSGFSDADIS